MLCRDRTNFCTTEGFHSRYALLVTESRFPIALGASERRRQAGRPTACNGTKRHAGIQQRPGRHLDAAYPLRVAESPALRTRVALRSRHCTGTRCTASQEDSSGSEEVARPDGKRSKLRKTRSPFNAYHQSRMKCSPNRSFLDSFCNTKAPATGNPVSFGNNNDTVLGHLP